MDYNIKNDSRRIVISSYPMIQSSSQRRYNYGQIQDRNVNIDDKIDTFLSSTLYNHTGLVPQIKQQMVNSKFQPSYSPYNQRRQNSPYKKETFNQIPIKNTLNSIPNTQTYHHQKINLNQQQFVRLKHSHTYNKPQHLPGIKLPHLPNLYIQQIEHNSKDNKNRIEQKKCSKLPYIIAALLLLILLVFLTLFIICKVNKNKIDTFHSDHSVNPPLISQNNIVSQPPCLKSPQPCQIISKNNYQTDYQNNIQIPKEDKKYPLDLSRQKSSIKQRSYLSQNISAEQLFYKMDHTNYPFLHLRRNSQSQTNR